jgi:hypothetical protein
MSIPAITMELIENGNLNDFLKYSKEPISNSNSIFNVTDIY